VDTSQPLSQDIIEPEQQPAIKEKIIQVKQQSIVVCESVHNVIAVIALFFPDVMAKSRKESCRMYVKENPCHF